VRYVLTQQSESQTLKSEGMIGLGHADVGVVDEPPVRYDPLSALPSPEPASGSALPGKAPRGRGSDWAPAGVFFPGRSRHERPSGLSGRRRAADKRVPSILPFAE
jgi:hypothetical protein